MRSHTCLSKLALYLSIYVSLLPLTAMQPNRLSHKRALRNFNQAFKSYQVFHTNWISPAQNLLNLNRSITPKSTLVQTNNRFKRQLIGDQELKKREVRSSVKLVSRERYLILVHLFLCYLGSQFSRSTRLPVPMKISRQWSRQTVMMTITITITMKLVMAMVFQLAPSGSKNFVSQLKFAYTWQVWEIELVHFNFLLI